MMLFLQEYFHVYPINYKRPVKRYKSKKIEGYYYIPGYSIPETHNPSDWPRSPTRKHGVIMSMLFDKWGLWDI